MGKLRTCLGFGPYEGICDNPAGTPKTKWWCERCDKLRIDHITEQLEQLTKMLEVK